jgi:hypothetical protein
MGQPGQQQSLGIFLSPRPGCHVLQHAVAMRKINLKAYPKFWADFVGRVETAHGTSYAVNVATLKGYILEWYGIAVHVTSSAERGEVYMLEKDYTGFMLKWS